MVELLATIVILGIIMIIAVTSITRMLEKAKKEYYTATEKEVKSAGESYSQNIRKILPKKIGQKTKITLKELQDKNYIKEVNDYKKQACYKDKTYVQIFKYDEDKYAYFSYLDCPNYTSKQTIKNISPDIKIEFLKSDKDKGDIKGDIKTAGAKITINGSSAASGEKNVKILGYNYVVYRNNKEVISSGSINANYKETVTINLSLNKYTPGTIKVRVTANNMYGLSSSKTEIATYKDLEPPKCVIKEADKETSAKTWINQNRKISVGCDDGDGVGCKRPQFTKTFKTDTKVGTITIEDEAGNKALCRVSVYIDKTKPTCSIKDEGDKGDNNWFISNVNLTLATSDNLSGVVSKDLTTNNTVSYNGKTSDDQTQDTRGTKWYGYVKDKAGNINNCQKVIKKDTKEPTCSIQKKGIVGENGWYKEENVLLSITRNDETSGIAKYGLSNSNSVKYNNDPKGVQSNTQGITWYGYVKDSAGNTGKCDSGSFKVDTDAPSCNISAKGKQGDNSWFIEATKISLETIDSVSGLANKGLTTGQNVLYNNITSSIQANTKNTTWYGYVKDNAGNTRSCNKSIKVDTDNPTCTVSKKGTIGNNGWYKKENVTLEITPSDNTSEVNTYGLANNTTPLYDKKLKKTQGNTTANGITWYGYVKDNAGRVGICNSGNFKVDKSSPTCTSSGGSTAWKTEAFQIIGKCTRDTGSSGCTLDQATKTINTFTNTTSMSPGKIFDNAGNETTCPGVEAHLDLENPTCTITTDVRGNSDDWYTSNVKLTLSTSDNNGSGIKGYKLTTSRTPSYNGTSKTTTVSDETTGITYHGYVKDKAGRIGHCSKTIRLDKTKPTCNITLSGTKGRKNWYTSNVRVTLEYGDTISDIKGYNLTTSTTASYNGSSPTTIHDNQTKGVTYYGYVKDKAGNKRKCSTTFKMDKVAPEIINRTLKCGKSPAPGASNAQKWYIELTIKDNFSGNHKRTIKYNELTAYRTDNFAEDSSTSGPNTSYDWIAHYKDQQHYTISKLCDVAGNCRTNGDNFSGTLNIPARCK